jgi:hypothetical protein
MQACREELIAHVGGKPSAIQRRLIERATRLTLRLELLDEQFMHGKVPTDCDNRTYIAWHNALRRTLVALGINPAAPAREKTSLASIVGAMRGGESS